MSSPLPESARRLKAARERAGLSQRAAAERLGIHFGSLNRYEKGKMKVPAEVLARAEALSADTSIDVGGPAPAPAGVDPGSAWWGRMDATRQQLASMARIADELASMARVTESTVGGLLASGVLVSPAASSGGSRTVAEILAALPPDQRAAAEARAAEILAPQPANGQTASPTPPKRAAGGER